MSKGSGQWWWVAGVDWADGPGRRSRHCPQTPTGHQVPKQTQIQDPDQLGPGAGWDVGGGGQTQDCAQGDHQPRHTQMV